MDIRGLLLIDAKPGPGDDLRLFAPPWALLDVAGRSPLERMAERMRLQGITPVTAVVEATPGSRQYGMALPAGIDCRVARSERFWRDAENTFNELAQSGAELVVMARLGPYAEVDFEALVQFHIERRCRVSRAVHGARPLDTLCLNASRRNDAASLFRSRLTQCRSDCVPFDHSGYVNPLDDAIDFRQFSVDVLSLKTETLPAGVEIRPGVWVAPRASIEKSARVLAPAFVGSSAHIRAGAVITRCSAIERRAGVDCGTVVENSTVLPYSCVGAGLDVAHSVVGLGHIANLRRGITVKVADSRLLGEVSTVAGRTLLQAAAAIPARIRQLWGETSSPQADLEDTLSHTSPSLEKAAGYQPVVCQSKIDDEFSPPLAIARRYGDQ